MPSPFPGMDPYLEGYLWPDVHHELASQVRRQLTPQLRPKYAAQIEVNVVEDMPPESEFGIFYPDVNVVKTPVKAEKPNSGGLAVTTANVTLPVIQPIPTRLSSVQIRDVAKNLLVTSIEIISPVNKREPGLTMYRSKRQRLYQAGVHLLEIDLLRRGQRPFVQPGLPKTSYAVALTRAASGKVDVWTLNLPDPLPVVPVPLLDTDPDAVVNLSTAVEAIYADAGYDVILDYTQNPPPPALTETEAIWIKQQINR
ncbi:MAG: DUF4058 family protein [Cyanobacteria bacterium P01_A01_bin.105]